MEIFNINVIAREEDPARCVLGNKLNRVFFFAAPPTLPPPPPPTLKLKTIFERN